jgi:hypothetical protein
MSDDVQGVTSNDVAPNLLAVEEAEANTHQDIAAVAEEEREDA